MKLRAPHGCSVAGVGGVEYSVDADGTVDVPNDQVRALLEHGFTQAEDAVVQSAASDPEPPAAATDDTEETDGETSRGRRKR